MSTDRLRVDSTLARAARGQHCSSREQCCAASRLRGGWAGLMAVLVALGVTARSHAAAADELRPFFAAYIWLWKDAPVAYSRLDFTPREDDVWVYTSQTEPRGIGHLYPMRPRLESTMRITASGVTPLSFHATGSGKRHDANVTFDWSTGRVTGIYESSPINLDVTPGVQDDLSVQIAMMLQLERGVIPDMLREIDKNGVRDYLFKRVGEETLTTAIGRVEAIIFATQARGSPRVTRYWCPPSDGYIPVKVQQTLNNHVEWTMTIDSLKRI
jgi:hypothetical protein